MGAVKKYGADLGGRKGLHRATKNFRGEFWASKLYPTKEMSHKFWSRIAQKLFQGNINFQSLLSLTLI